MSRQSPGLHPVGPILDAAVIDLAGRTGHFPRYYQLLNSSNCRAVRQPRNHARLNSMIKE